MKKELEKRTDEMFDLNDRLIGLQQAKDNEKDAFEKHIADLKVEFQDAKDVLTNQNNALSITNPINHISQIVCILFI